MAVRRRPRGLCAAVSAGLAAALACLPPVGGQASPPRSCEAFQDWSCREVESSAALPVPSLPASAAAARDGEPPGSVAVEVSWQLPAGCRGYCLIAEEGSADLSGEEVIVRAAPAAGLPPPTLAGAPAPAPESRPKGNLWSTLGHAVRHVVEKPPTGLVKQLGDLTKPLPTKRPPAPAPAAQLEEVLEEGDDSGVLAAEAEKLFGAGEHALEQCGGLKKEECVGDCEWHDVEGRCSLGEDAAMALLAELMLGNSSAGSAADGGTAGGELMLMLSCASRSEASCAGQCQWLPSDHPASAAAAASGGGGPGPAAGAAGGGICVAASFALPLATSSGPMRVLHLSSVCGNKTRETCRGKCEWATGVGKCEVEELRALQLLGGKDFRRQGRECRLAARSICDGRPSCGWQHDYGRCSIAQDLVMAKMMEVLAVVEPPRPGGRRLAAAAAAGQLWGHGGGEQGGMLRLGGLQPNQRYFIRCAALRSPSRRCEKSEGAGDAQECVVFNAAATLQQLGVLGDHHTVWSVLFVPVLAPGFFGGVFGSLLMVVMLVGMVGALALLFSNRHRLMRRFYARRIALPEDSMLMACPINASPPGARGWTELT